MSRRDRIVEAIRKEPGIPIGEIIRQTGFGSGTVYHHLHTLERSRKIVSEIVGRRKLFYAVHAAGAHAAQGRRIALLRGDTIRRIAETILGNPGHSIQDVIAATGVCPQVAYYHVGRLLQAGLVHRAGDRGYRSLSADADLTVLLAALTSGDKTRSADAGKAGDEVFDASALASAGVQRTAAVGEP
ncbi:MAG: hypothetical protein HY556_10580 [Euryarchaeota archaeon]|nr:hypothetical protein [Euryarchaeota archaeon]